MIKSVLIAITLTSAIASPSFASNFERVIAYRECANLHDRGWDNMNWQEQIHYIVVCKPLYNFE